MATKEYSYRNHEVICKVFILDQDVSVHVKSVEGIEQSLDYPQLNEFRINEAVFTLSDGNNDFNPQQTETDNFYKRWGITARSMITPAIGSSGYRAPVKIEAGFIANGTERVETIFEGQIFNVHKDAKTGDVRIVCSDLSQRIRDEDVTDFGIPKSMIVDPSGGNLHGNYPFFIGLTEPSLESVSSSGLMRRQVLRTEGALNENNFRELPTGVETEGGPLDNDRTFKFKSPYRSRTIESVVTKLLDHYDLDTTTPEIKIPIAINEDGPFFSNLGRPGYETVLPDDPINNFELGQWQWPGTVTDMIANESEDKIYLLVSQTGSSISQPETENPKPRIIEWDLTTDDRKVLSVIRKTTNNDDLEECWRFVANSDFTTFYVLGTQPRYIQATRSRDSGVTTRPGFEFGSYDSSEYNNTVNSKILIHRLQESGGSWTRSDYITNSVSSNLLPQLAMHYHLGFARTESQSQNRFPNRQGNLPDSRRNFYLAEDGTTLYYPFANRTEFGVAKASSANSASKVISANRDSDGFNLAGFDFFCDEDNDHIFLAYTNIGSAGSRFKIIRKDESY